MDKVEIDYEKIPKETMAWILENGARRIKSPFIYFLKDKWTENGTMTYGYDYLVNTPLEEIIENKKGYVSVMEKSNKRNN